MTRMARVLVYLVGILVCVAHGAGAQQNTAELRGRVLDQQAAVLPGVSITITNQATGVYRTTASTEDGTYFVPALAPGTYGIVAELSGFKKYSRADVRLDLGRTTSLDLQLELGGVAETVTITAAT